MRFMALVLAAIMPAPAFAQPQQPFNLHLICIGDGVQRRSEVSTGHLSTPQGAYSGAVTYGRDDPFSDEVVIEITGDGGRVRIPRAMLPLIRGGQNGWMQLRNVEVTPDEITASATINLLNRARIRISRVTGAISMSVLRGRFDGRCEAYDPATIQRAF